MNVLNIAWKEIKTAVRDVKTFLMMLGFPIVLILILGTALSGAFSSSVKVKDMTLLYRSEESNPQLVQSWNGMVEVLESQGIRTVQAEAGEDGREAVRANRYTAYAEVDDSGIRLYGSNKNTIEENVMQGMLTAFADRYKLAASAFSADPAAAAKISAAGIGMEDAVHEASIDPKRQPGSIDYYAMAMTTMFALYAAFQATFLIPGERVRNTAIRLSAAPVSKGALFAGKVIGCTVLNVVCMMAVVLFSKLAYQADWGSRYDVLLGVLASEVVLAVSLGLGLSYLFKVETARAIAMVFLQVAALVGGAYFPLGDTSGGVVGFLLHLNPLLWANEALTRVIYDNDAAAALPTIGLNVGIAAAFLFLSAVFMRKREAL